MPPEPLLTMATNGTMGRQSIAQNLICSSLNTMMNDMPLNSQFHVLKQAFQHNCVLKSKPLPQRRLHFAPYENDMNAFPIKGEIMSERNVVLAFIGFSSARWRNGVDFKWIGNQCLSFIHKAAIRKSNVTYIQNVYRVPTYSHFSSKRYRITQNFQCFECKHCKSKR